jgi:hypothetical protein
MAGAANPAMTQGVNTGMRQNGGRSFNDPNNYSTFENPKMMPVSGGNQSDTYVDSAGITRQRGQLGFASAAPNAGGATGQQLQPPQTNMANPYNQASMAQQASMARTAAGMGQTAAGGMAAYQNPYENQVVQQTLRDVGSAAQMGLNQIGAQAQQARAFGGSRQGIAEAEAMKGYTQQMADAAGQLRAQGFNTALGASQADLSRQLGAAGQLAGMGQQSFGYGEAIGNQQMKQGGMQQAAMQDLINAARGQYLNYVNAPTQKMQLPLQALGMVPYGTTQTTTGGGTSQTFNPGLFNYMQVGASMFG